MKPVQPILISILVMTVVLYLSRFRSVLLDRLTVLGLFVLGSFAVLFPDLTTAVANWIGIGRGADLILYIFLIGSVMAFILLYSKVDELQRLNTTVIRELALKDAQNMKASPDQED